MKILINYTKLPNQIKTAIKNWKKPYNNNFPI